jgi:glyceraldehyde-3-phosphate dehydrogenase/erythrose-4-phosphate dehydrogenase
MKKAAINGLGRIGRMVLRHYIEGRSKNIEIVAANDLTSTEDLASRGILPPLVREWSDNVRELGNESAHPEPGLPPN